MLARMTNLTGMIPVCTGTVTVRLTLARPEDAAQRRRPTTPTEPRVPGSYDTGTVPYRSSSYRTDRPGTVATQSTSTIPCHVPPSTQHQATQAKPHTAHAHSSITTRRPPRHKASGTPAASQRAKRRPLAASSRCRRSRSRRNGRAAAGYPGTGVCLRYNAHTSQNTVAKGKEGPRAERVGLRWL